MKIRLGRTDELVSALITLLFMLFVLGVILRFATRLVPGAAGPIRAVTSRADLGNV